MGLYVQNTIQPTSVRHLRGSKCKHLQGDRVVGSFVQKYSTVRKINRGIFNAIVYFQNFNTAGPFFALPVYGSFLEFLQVGSKRYQTRTDNYSFAGGAYVGVSSIAGAGDCPTSAGYPAGFDGANQPIGVGSPWGGEPPHPAVAPMDIFTNTDIGIDFANLGGSSPTVREQLTNELDFSGNFIKAKTDMAAQPWNWNLPAFGKVYDEPDTDLSGVVYNGKNSGVGALDPNSFTGALIGGGIAGLPADWLNAHFFEQNQVVFGWRIEIAVGAFDQNAVYIYSGLGRNQTGTAQPYTIFRLRRGPGSPGQPYYPLGVPYTLYTLSVVSQGIIPNNGVIGPGQQIDLPFPPSAPWPLTDIGNQVCTSDYHIAVMDYPGSFLRTWGLKLGTSTALT